MIPIQILRVLSTIRQFDVPALLMGGQACVLYGAAEYSRDVDLAVHFSAPPDADLGPVPPLRIDIMSLMRGVAPFAELWDRRTTIALAGPSSSEEFLVDLMSLSDLVQAKKTQRDKDWPMLRRLVDASYAAARDTAVLDEQIGFWLAELRSPEFLAEAVAEYPARAARSPRPGVIAARGNGDIADALASEQATEMTADRVYWAPLRRELEALRHAARRSAGGSHTGNE